MKYVFASDLAKIQNIKGEILKNDGRVYLIKTLDIFTVWIPEDGFIITHTFYENEALNAYNKYSEGV